MRLELLRDRGVDRGVAAGVAAGDVGAAELADGRQMRPVLLLDRGVDVDELPAAGDLLDAVHGEVGAELIHHVGQRLGAGAAAADDENLAHQMFLPSAVGRTA